jgi:hypothetical protein
VPFDTIIGDRADVVVTDLATQETEFASVS